MPSIKDNSTVEAIAVEFTRNGRCKVKAMETVGYAASYANSYCGKLWENKALIEAIARLDAEKNKRLDLSRNAQHDRLIAIIDDSTTSKSVKVSALRELNEMLGYHREKAPNEEQERAIRARMTKEELALAEELARLRTKAQCGPRLTEGA